MSSDRIPQALLDHAISTLKQDETLSDDLLSGQFYQKDGWLEGLPRNAQSLICAVQQAGDHPDRPILCSHCAAQHVAGWKATRRIEEVEAAIALYVVAVKYTKPDDSNRPDRLSALAFACQAKWEQTRRTDDLDTAVHFFRRAVAAAEPSHPALGAFVTNLGYIIKQRWNRTKSSDDRLEAKSNFLRAVNISENHPLQAQLLSNFGEFIRLTTLPSDNLRVSSLIEAVEYHERAIQRLRPFLSMPYGTIWRNAAIAHHTLFQINHEEKHSANCLDYYNRSVGQTANTDSNYALWLAEYAQHYMERHRVWDRTEDVQKALNLYETLLRTRPDSFAATIGKADALRIIAGGEKDIAESRRIMSEACRLADSSVEMIEESSNSRGWAYYRTSAISSCRYDLDGERRYLDRAVDLSKLSLKYTEHEACWDFNRWCAQVCRSRHILDGSPGDLSQAFTAIHAAIDQLEEWDTANLASCIWVLGSCFTSQYNCSGDIQDLDQALNWLSAACIMPGKRHNLALTQNDLANALCTKFRQTSSVDDLNRAIQTYALSIKNLEKLSPEADHTDLAMLKNGMGHAMLERYLFWGSQEDLASAINLFRGSLSAADARNPRYAGRACNLSYSLILMFSLRPELRLLQDAQSYLVSVLNSPVGLGLNISQLVNCNLGNTYLRGYEITQNVADLDSALEHYEKVKNSSGADGRYRADVTMNIGVALHKKATRSGHFPDYIASVASFDEAVNHESLHDDHKTISRTNRAEVFNEIFEKFHDIDYGRRALKECSELASRENARTDLLMRAANVASVLEVSVNSDYRKAYEQIRKAVNLLPQAMFMYSNRFEQLRLVRKYHYLPSSATALAMGASVPAAQIVLALEQSRAFIWNHFVLSATPLDTLRKAHPKLSSQFESLRSTLMSQTVSDSNSVIVGVLPAKDQIRLERHANADAYTRLLQTIRNENGFKDFLLPSIERNTTASSKDFPVVYLNISEYRCDALITSSQGAHAVALPELRMADVVIQAQRMYEVQAGIMNDFLQACTSFEEVMLWLWTTTAKPILTYLEREHLFKHLRGKQRIYWISSGWLSVFPIHAAGDWKSSRSTQDCPSVHERVISSYVPSIGVLDFLRRRAEHLESKGNHDEALLVGMPQTPDMNETFNLDADVEVALIKSIIDKKIPVDDQLSPRLKEITSRLRTCEIAHFACHGVADHEDPSKSAIRLADWTDRPLNVRALMKMEIAHCRLVFLSACETAANKDLLLRDEGMHVAGGFNMAGVPHTISGMWKISDEASLELARAFYTELFGLDDHLRYQGTAEGLHASVDYLRDAGYHPVLWGAFVHMGP